MSSTGSGAAVLFSIGLVVAQATCAKALADERGKEANDATKVWSSHLPESVPPVLGCWFWALEEFEPRGYEAFLDMVSRHARFDILTASLRVPGHEMTEPLVHDQIKAAAAYARRYGIKMAMDLDVRMARREFQRRYPDELQEMLRLRTVELGDSGEATLTIASETLNDHQTGRTTPYIPLKGRLVRVYSYERNHEGIVAESVRDVTEACRLEEASPAKVTVAIPCDANTTGRQACVMVAFTHLAADVFAPHLLSFQREIFRQYADAGLVGTCKDEWGFPPCYDGCPAKNDFWFSRFRAEAYARRTGGRDLVRDCLLMCFGEQGRVAERQAAINHFMQMSLQRNVEIETDCYEATKEVFGPDAYTGTHATWVPYPGIQEFKKNGLSWWAAPRDFGQTDESTPYCVRTALAKRWGSPVWYNMFYATTVEPYETQLYSSVLAGGRINYHPIYPCNVKATEAANRQWSRTRLLTGELMRADCRMRLLNFISQAPLDCPVAIVFGHACAVNWAGPAYDDVGLGVTNALWRAGFPADLIPSSEIAAGALRVDEEGYLCYGPQRYIAAVLYHPQFESPATAALFRRAASARKTQLFRIGAWTRDFDARPFDGDAALPRQMATVADHRACVAQVLDVLERVGVELQSKATEDLVGWGGRAPTAMPPKQGGCRLIDGTWIVAFGARRVSGDPIEFDLQIDDHWVEIDAMGVAAVRLNEDGSVAAFAAGGLKELSAWNASGPTFELRLAERADVAFWRDADGRWRGVLQGLEGPIPGPLAKLTDRWLRLDLPTPLPSEVPSTGSD